MKSTSRHHVVAALVAAVFVLAAATVYADDDPPGRVARLNYVKGSVSFRPASVEEWTPATVNYPLTIGDHLWTDTSSWAEMHIGSTAIRLAPTTAFSFLNLDDRTTQIRLSEGAVDVRVRNLDGSEAFEIDTPQAAISLTRPGIYRVDVLPEGSSTRVTVRFGGASVTADGPDFFVRDGETAAVYGEENVSHEIYRAAAPDSWERWCRSRDEREDRAISVRYVSYETTGYEDLDDYGTWTNVSGYGWGWQPRVAYGWAPYRYGQWRWVWPWGWTWIDDASWGFAPFHYGRWACLHNSWYWFPGAYVRRPWYAPALVAFFGGSNWGVSFGIGRVGWFPLAPGEVWMPHYHASYGYLHNVNYMHLHGRSIDYGRYDVSRGSYVNRAIPGAITAVPRDTFVGGRAVARDALAVDARAAMRASVVGGSVALPPRVDSVVGRRAGYVPRPPATALQRTVVARSQPAAAPIPFAAQERAIQANGGRSPDQSGTARLRAEAAGRTAGGPVRMAGARNGAFQGQPARADAARGNEPLSAGSPGSSSAGAAGLAGARRPGERAVERGTAAAPSMSGTPRPEVNDRPSWARPRSGGETVVTNPRDDGGVRPGARGRGDGAINAAPSSGGLSAPAGPGSGQAVPRSGQRTNPRGENSAPANNDRPTFARPESGVRPEGGARPRGETSAPANNDRPTFARPSGGESPRPSGGGSARPSGGDSRPAGARSPGGQQSAPPPSQPSGTAQPRGGGRGGTSASFESTRPSGSYGGSAAYGSSRPSDSYGGADAYGSSRPSYSSRGSAPSYGSRAVPQYRSMPESRPTPQPQYRSVPESRAVPQYRSMPESRPTPQPQYRAMPESRPTPQPQYRAMPESRPTPQYRSVPESRPTPQYRSMPESRPTPQPQYRSVPESRAVPQYRSVPESRPMPQYRSVPESRPMPSAPQYQPRGGGEVRSHGGAVPRGGGGGRAPSAAPAPRAPSSGGQGAPRGARNRG